MLLIPQFSFSLTHHADWIFDLTRLKMAAAPLVAFIPPGLGTAMGACPLHVPIGKKTATPGAVALLYHPGIHKSVLDKSLYNLPGAIMVGWIVGHPEMVESDHHAAKRLVEVRMVTF